MRHRWNSYPV